MDRISINWSKMLWLPVLLFGAILSVPAASDDDGMASNSPAASVQMTWLDYQEVSFPVVNRSISIRLQSAPFKKEPVLGKAKILRGSLEFGSDGTNWMAFAWDQAAGKLYLDLNRNLDLTDDDAGVFVSEEGRMDVSATFTNIHLPFKTASGDRQFLVDLTLWDGGRWRSCSTALRSFWQGKMVWDGAEWQVGIVQTPFDRRPNSPPNRFLLLRPWAARDASFSASADSFEAFRLPQKLFAYGHAWRVDCVDEPQGTNSGFKLQFTDEQPALGEVRIAGDFIQHILLESGPFTVRLGKPEAPVRIPTGRYEQLKVWLTNGNAQACRSPVTTRITIDEKNPTVLTIGGPLTNSATAKRHGKSLYLTYRLVGAGGDTYQLVEQDRQHPPEFAIYQGGQKIASGKFQYG